MVALTNRGNIHPVSLAALLCLCATSALAQAKPDLLKKAAEVSQICAKHMPNSQAAKDEFKATGFRYEGLENGFHIYSLEGRRLLAATTNTSARQQGCMVSVSKMTPEQGMELIKPWVKTAKAKKVPAAGSNMVAAWKGSFKGGPVNLGVVKKINFGIMRGAAIAAIAAN